MNAPSLPPPAIEKTLGLRTVERPRPGRTESFRAARRMPRDAPAERQGHLGTGANVGAASAGLRSTHGAMLGALLRAPPRKAVRRYVVLELRFAGRRMGYPELIDVIACPGYDHNSRPCARHGRGNCGGFEWLTDVDGRGNVVGKWERKIGVATRYELAVAVDALLGEEVLEITGGQLRLRRGRRVGEKVPAAERWRREDESLRLYWQQMEVHESRSVYVWT